MTCIYVNNKKIILTSDASSDASRIKNTKKSNSFHISDKFYLKKITSDFLNDLLSEDKIIIHGNSKQLYKKFIALYPEINAAGGVVFNKQDEILLIFRRGTWDLPKGKTETGETARESALREASEETGVEKLTVLDNLPESYHMYKINNQWVLKRTQWFLMKAPLQILKPQTEEEITNAEWIPRSSIHNLKTKMFASLQDVITAALNKDSSKLLK